MTTTTIAPANLRWLKTSEVCESLGISKMTFSKWQQRGCAPIPNALLIERRPVSDLGAKMFEIAWGTSPSDRDEVAETVIAIGVQNATRQASDPLRSKVDAWSAAIKNLQVASKVLWIVEPAACKVLVSLGVGDSGRRPGQILVSSGAVGLGGENFEVLGLTWWVLAVPRSVSAER